MPFRILIEGREDISCRRLALVKRKRCVLRKQESLVEMQGVEKAVEGDQAER